jgi:perosamine synthetase
MWVRTQLKIGWDDLLLGALRAVFPPQRETQLKLAESFFADGGRWMTAFSVRTGFELLLKSLDLKPGDEIVFSAVNVKGMVKIVTELGFVPVPVDISFGGLAPSVTRLEAAITPRSKVFIAAHLFGTRSDLDAAFKIAKSHGLLAIEDCAQAFNGGTYSGSPEADVVMFSFGPIKTATALGGALLNIRSPQLMARVKALETAYPIQSEKKQLKRIISAAGIKIVSLRAVLGFVYSYYKKRGRNYEEELSNKVRDVAPLKQKGGLQYQPSASLLWMMNRRMRQLTNADLAVRTGKGQKLASLLNGIATLPGQTAKHHDYWLFAVVTDAPRELMEALRSEGFDAGGLPRSQTVEVPNNRPDLLPLLAKDMLDAVVVVPCYESMPDSEIVREAAVIRKVLAKSGKQSSQALLHRMDEA